MLRMFASGVVIATIALAAPALAAANTTRASDPKDAHGALDIASVSSAHVGSSVVHTLRTYKPFRSQLLKQRNTFIAFAFDTDLNGKLDDIAIVAWIRGGLRGALLDSNGDPTGSPLHVTRPDSRTVKLTIPSGLLGSPAVYRWLATTEYQGPGCKKPCYDVAPNNGTLKEQLKALAAPLTVHIIGPGRVFSIPHGIACPGQCVHKFGRGDTVYLNPAPIGTNVFVGWGGACTGTGVCKVTAGSSAVSVIANFAPTFALTVVPVAPGSVLIAPPGSTCAASQVCTQRYAWHTNVTLTAQAPPGYVFTGWSGACSGTTPTCTVTMDADQTVTAVFSIQPTVGPVVEATSPNGLLWSGDERARLEPW